jgi:hypothetical protein
MATNSVWKIQLRRGLQLDLPGQPTSLSPLTFPNGLDEGELGYATDTGRLFVGMGTDTPLSGMPNYQRAGFPYQNIEVLTENSPLNLVLGGAFSDNQLGFVRMVPLTQTTTFQTLQISEAGVATNFYIDVAITGVGSGGTATTGANASISYFLFDSSNNPIRQGRLSVLWNTAMTGVPLCTDEAQVAGAHINDIQWQAVYISSLDSEHIVLQYINQTGGTPSMLMRVDRPNVLGI